jgi:hypothetical protein
MKSASNVSPAAKPKECFFEAHISFQNSTGETAFREPLPDDNCGERLRFGEEYPELECEIK